MTLNSYPMLLWAELAWAEMPQEAMAAWVDPAAVAARLLTAERASQHRPLVEYPSAPMSAL